MNRTLKWLLLVCLLRISASSLAQTAGSGTLSTIESLASKEAANSKKVGELNRKHGDSYVLEDIKGKRLLTEQAELERKQADNAVAMAGKMESKLNEIETGTSWINRRESARNGWKEYNPGTCGAGGPPPICKVDHWYRVSVAEAMREYDALVKKELDKIRAEETKYDEELRKKRREVLDFQDGDNEFSQNRDKITKEMNELVAANTDIRQQMAKLSQTYVTKIEAEIKSIQNNDIKGLMSDIAHKHYAILKIGFMEVKLTELDEEEREALAGLSAKIRRQNSEKVADLNRQADQKLKDIGVMETRTITEVKSYNDEIAKLRREQREIEDKLDKKEELTAAEVARLTSRQGEIKDLIDAASTKADDANKAYNDYKVRTEGEIAKLKNEAWNKQVNLPTELREAEGNLKEAYVAKRTIIDDAITGRKTKLSTLTTSISTKRDEFRSKAKDYEAILEPERLRLMEACKQAGASCWGSDVVSKIWGNANKLIGCSYDMENQNVLYSGCEEAFAHYNSVYKSLTDGISDEELGKLGRSGSALKYEKLIQKLK